MNLSSALFRGLAAAALLTPAFGQTAWSGLNLYEFYSIGGTPPDCGDLGQEAPFQGNSFDAKGNICHKINICHGNAGFGWNAITVDRDSLDPTKTNGHAGDKHNDVSQGNKRPDYFPDTTAVPNPNGAGFNNGYLDGNCNFECDDTNGGCGPPPPPPCVGACIADPHFLKWNGEYYDFHGECDLLFVSNPYLDLDIHIRTTRRFDYSFISEAAVRIGEDVLEVAGWGEYLLNGVSSVAKPDLRAGNLEIDYKMENKKTHLFSIKIAHNQTVELKTFKDWVSVKVNGATQGTFADSKGMMGEFLTGRMVGRDGETIIEDPNAFGQEWQVLESEPKLFQTDRAPQHPIGKCILPDPQKSDSRRLGQSVAEEAATKACSVHHSDATGMEMCVYDVMASGDLSMAEAGAF